jgi:hypothetical protein
MREVRVEQLLRKLVVETGGICKKWTCPGQRGVPDRIIIWPGAIFFVETKAPKGKLSMHQIVFHKQLSAFGFEVVVLNTQQKVRDWVDAQSRAILKAATSARLIPEFLPADYYLHKFDTHWGAR